MSHDSHDHHDDHSDIVAGLIVGQMAAEDLKKPRVRDTNAPPLPPVHKHTVSNREVLTVAGVSTGLVLAFMWFMGMLG
jgi:hypothetical protein